jgi:tetratricopeptide (TPR) repeat protein
MRQVGLLVLVSVAMLGSGCSSLRFKSDDEVRSAADEAYVEGRYNDALPYYDELVRRDDEDVDARLKRARSRDLGGNPLAAREEYGAVIEFRPEETRARIYRAELSMRNGDLDAAEADLNYLTSQGQLDAVDRVLAYKFLGVIQTKRQNMGGAVTCFRQATSASLGASDELTLRHLAECHYNLGHCLYALNRINEAHEEFVLFAQLAPRAGMSLSGEDYYLLGVTAHLSGQYAAAQRYLSKADPSLRTRFEQEFGPVSKQYH